MLPVTPPPGVTVTPVTVPVTGPAAIDFAACTAAVALVGAAAFFSIKGMVALFPGAPLSVVGMVIAMEAAKLFCADSPTSRCIPWG